MSRRGYPSSEIYEERDREYYSSSGRGGRTKYEEIDEVDIRERRREPEFLREDYGRTSAGPLVVRDDKRESIEYRSRDRPRERPRGREVETDEVIIARGPKERPRERDVVEKEITYRHKERERPAPREEVREEIIYRERERQPPPPQQVRREHEEFVFRPRTREPSYEREEITIRERERDREKPRKKDYEEEEIIIRRDERERERPRKKEYEEDEIIIRRGEQERERPRKKEAAEDQIVIRRGEREIPRERDRGYEKEEIIIRKDDRDRLKPRARSYERESISISRDERERPRARSRGGFQEEDIIIRKNERESVRGGSSDYRDEEVIIRRDEREREREPPKRRERDFEDDVIIRHDDNDKRHKDEIIIRRNERSPSPEYVPPPPPEPESIRAPPIHQEIITHHRHIDHGFEVRPPKPAPPPPRPRSPSPELSYEEIEIRRHGSRNGRHYDEDIIIDRRAPSPRRRRSPSPLPARRRSPSPLPAPRSHTYRDELDIAEEAEYYNRRETERSYIGEGYNGATKDWAIVDVPPGTKRVEMEGIGGAKEEITWQRYNGVRRSKFIAEEDGRGYSGGGELVRQEEVVIDNRDHGRRFVAQKDRKDAMWTEITKDLVIKEAIEEMGYDYEETEFFFYVMVYLRYEDVLRLVELTEDIKHDRRDRIREIQWEREVRPERERPLVRKQLAAGPWDEERVFEREVVYEGVPPPPRRYR